jgi:hypothetical protein
MTLTIAYRVGICQKNRTRPERFTKWLFDYGEALAEKRRLEESDSEHSFLLEESPIDRYHVEWENQRPQNGSSSVHGTTHSVSGQIFLLPSKDATASAHRVVRELLGHDDFKIRRSWLIA